MGSFVCYQKLPAKAIRKSAKRSIDGIEEFFKCNPKKKICVAELWYGRTIDVRKGHVAEDVNAAAELAIKNDRGTFDKI
jgi:hypothetical protein